MRLQEIIALMVFVNDYLQIIIWKTVAESNLLSTSECEDLEDNGNFDNA